MSLRQLTLGGALVGSTLGSFAPLLWGGEVMSMASIVASTIGGCVGIWAGYRLSKRF